MARHPARKVTNFANENGALIGRRDHSPRVGCPSFKVRKIRLPGFFGLFLPPRLFQAHSTLLMSKIEL